MSNKLSIAVILLTPLVLIGCAADYSRKSTENLCIDYLTYPAANVYQNARKKELEKRSEDCHAYVEVAKERIRAAQQPVGASTAAPLIQSYQLEFTPMQIPQTAPQQSGTSGVSAFFTGRVQYGPSVTGQSVANCEYSYAGHTFVRAFMGSCPSSIQVQ